MSSGVPFTIGILAGMGPRSTAPFLEMVLDECQRQYGARWDEDFPHMLAYSLPTPFFPGRPLDHDAMRDAILGGLRRLAGMGVNFISMPCNMAHAYYEELAAAIGVPLLHIADETVKALPRGSKVALLATSATVQAGIYQQRFAAAGLGLVYDPAWQPDVDALIANIKGDSRAPGNVAAMRALLKQAEEAGADCAAIACTDLTPVALGIETGLRIVDSAQCLAAATVKRYLMER